ncbi:MAG: hypothetical protein U9Q72_01955 [Patescibacteria group bacterium]|nr:hypothetical protein [Patescibacteria group bacterium]
MKKLTKKSQELLKTITTENIKPNPCWHYVLRNYLFWSLFFIFAIFGGIVFSIILYAVLESDFNTLAESLNSRIKFFIASLPFLWIILLILFSIISIFGVKHTKTGYRYTAQLVITANILISILLGLLFFYSGGAQKIDNIFAKKITSYASIEEHKISRWSNPENGFLAGTILEKQDDNVILLKDFSGEKWSVNVQNAVLHPRSSLKPAEKVKMIGRMIQGKIFIAHRIHPWERRGMRSR